ncbi:MAG: family 43 glycosylhydrolase [Candidatus Eisenbacteria bacterium]|nr:family 43 glycosylhydrolase [Candidatus Eisenbacteria bacterium]
MRRICWLLALMIALIPSASQAIQLRWSSGGTSLSFTSATRCTLVVEADSAEQTLSREWRLLWAADSSSIQPLALGAELACQEAIAQVSGIDLPTTRADSAANLTTAHFCVAGSSAPSGAQYVLDLPVGTRGKLKVVALDPNDPDSSRVIESNEVTYNGGLAGSYPPVVLHASSVHQSLQLRVTAVGSGLSTASSMSIVALDSSWTLPLTVTARSDGSLMGAASVAALLPASQASVGSESGAVSAASLAADEEPGSLSPQGCQGQFNEELLLPPPPLHGYTIQPKDFAFTRGFVDQSSNRFALHLFYIRHNYWYYPPPPAIQHPELDEKNLGHIWTTDFNSWYGPGGLNKPDTVALTVRSGKFDEFHVWAPTIVQRGPTFWMFYTGVRDEGGRRNQRIGVATSTDLNTWTPNDNPVLTAPDVPWARKNPTAYDGQQLRDPFVMEDPVNSGQWLMYFVSVDSLTGSKMAVGVARSLGDFATWAAAPDSLGSTQKPTFQGTTTIVESPHVFRRHGQWWMPYTVGGDQVFFETTASADPTDATTEHWTDPIWLRGVAEGQPTELQYWHASEYLRINSTEYLAAFNDNASSIDIKGMFAPANAAVDSFLLYCPPIAGVADRDGSGNGVRMAISRLRWGAPEVGLRLELPSRMPVRLAVYDIAGRRRSTLLDRELPGGVTEVTWDGRDDSGVRVASGMYFIRLTYTRGARVSRLVMLR